MIFAVPKEFKNWVIGRWVDPNIPDEILKKLKEFNETLKDVSHKDHFDFPR